MPQRLYLALTASALCRTFAIKSNAKTRGVLFAASHWMANDPPMTAGAKPGAMVRCVGVLVLVYLTTPPITKYARTSSTLSVAWPNSGNSRATAMHAKASARVASSAGAPACVMPMNSSAGKPHAASTLCNQALCFTHPVPTRHVAPHAPAHGYFPWCGGLVSSES